MRRGVEQTFYGSPMGGRGVMDNVRSAGAAMGVGGAGTMRQTMKANLEYANKLKEVEEFLAKESLAYGTEASKQLPWQAAQIGSISPPAQLAGGQSYSTPAQQNPWMGALSGMASSLGSMNWGGSTPTYSNTLTGGGLGYDSNFANLDWSTFR